MALGGVLGNGSKIAYSSSSPVSWTRVAQLANIDKFISLVANLVDTTVYSTSRIMTQMAGMIPAPTVEMTLEADLDPSTCASQEALRSLQDSGATIWWRIEVPVNRAQSSFRAWEFRGFVQNWSPELPIADRQMIKVTIVFDGDGVAVYNPGASQIT